MKKIYLILLLLPLYVLANAQHILEIKDKAFNWGGKLGCNATFPIISSLSIDGVEMDDIRPEYRVGAQATIFARVNIDKFFIEPSLAWQYTEGEIRFEIPSDNMETEANPATSRLNFKTASLEIPVMIGYYLVKEGPYALSISVGPTIKYNYKTNYETSMTDIARQYTDDNTPFSLGVAAGVGVSIWRLFLNFNYEVGLNKVTSEFEEITPETPTAGTLSLQKRTNMMSFSLGFLF